jgi:hypothetical protein
MNHLACRTQAAAAERLAALAVRGHDFSPALLDHLTRPILAAYMAPACEPTSARRIHVALDLLGLSA